MSQTTVIRIGTRASALAQWQARWVAHALEAHGHAVRLVPITTRGDAAKQSPIAEIGTRGVFTNELQRALLEGRIDVAVHSLKDLPTAVTAGIALAAVPPRESPCDVLVSREGLRLSALPNRARIGTGSPRRQTQLWHLRPDFQMNPIRGNVDTRLRKLFEGACDALILAEAGLRRLGLTEHVTEILPPTTMMPAVGQGARFGNARRRRVHPAGPCAAGRPRVPRRRGRRTVVDGVDRRWLFGAARQLGPASTASNWFWTVSFSARMANGGLLQQTLAHAARPGGWASASQVNCWLRAREN